MEVDQSGVPSSPISATSLMVCFRAHTTESKISLNWGLDSRIKAVHIRRDGGGGGGGQWITVAHITWYEANTVDGLSQPLIKTTPHPPYLGSSVY